MFDATFLNKEEYIFGENFEDFFKNNPNIIFSNTHTVWNFLLNAKHISSPYILVTHNSDHSVTQTMANYAETIPNLKYWFGQNIDCNSNKIISIPIGMENTKNWTKFSKKDLLSESSNKNKIPTKLAYANFSFYTNPNERLSCYKVVQESSFITDKCTNNVTQDDYQIWLDDVTDHHYILCPRGNGIDTHRLWESLYLGRIPITTKNQNTKYYENLPILLVDDWSEVTEDLLKSKIELILIC